MSTSAYKYITAAARQKRRLLLAAAVYSAVTILCAVLHLVYTRFSYGEDSPFLQWMFLCPLLGGVLPAGTYCVAQGGLLGEQQVTVSVTFAIK